MENFIKEAKNDFACGILSSTNFESNAMKLQLAMLAYNFNNWFRNTFIQTLQNLSRLPRFG
jgi:hypothetical protein